MTKAAYLLASIHLGRPGDAPTYAVFSEPSPTTIQQDLRRFVIAKAEAENFDAACGALYRQLVKSGRYTALLRRLAMDSDERERMEKWGVRVRPPREESDASRKR